MADELRVGGKMPSEEDGRAGEARRRAEEAWDARFKHVKAANVWLSVGERDPLRKEISEILSTWMDDYATADAKAERALRDLAARQEAQAKAPTP